MPHLLARRTVIGRALLGSAVLITGCQTAAPTTAPAAATRRVTHVGGDTEVPADPQRVVVLDCVDDVLALGVRPVGAAQWAGSLSGVDARFPAYLGNQTDGLTLVGSSAQPSLEAIAGLRPDLILGRKQEHAALYDQLRQIAPTVIVDIEQTINWKNQLRLYAAALGRESKADELLSAYQRRADGIRAKIAALPQPPLVSVVRFDPDRVVAYQRRIFAGIVLADAGVPRPESQDVDNGSLNVSIERLDLIDGDILFAVQPTPSNTSLTRVKQSALWNTLKVVQTNRVVDAPYDYWIASWGIQGANQVLGDLERTLLGGNR